MGQFTRLRSEAGHTVTRVEQSPTEADARLLAKAPEMAAMLRELEGIANEEYGMIQCPVCDSMWDHSDTETYHKPDCRLATLLRELEP